MKPAPHGCMSCMPIGWQKSPTTLPFSTSPVASNREPACRRITTSGRWPPMRIIRIPGWPSDFNKWRPAISRPPSEPIARPSRCGPETPISSMGGDEVSSRWAVSQSCSATSSRRWRSNPPISFSTTDCSKCWPPRTSCAMPPKLMKSTWASCEPRPMAVPHPPRSSQLPRRRSLTLSVISPRCSTSPLSNWERWPTRCIIRRIWNWGATIWQATISMPRKTT